MTNKPSQMDGYLRVSRKMGRHGEGYISPTVQKDAIQRWADYKGITIAEWHFDEDESGGTQNRPGLRAAMARVEAGKTDGIACWRLNRFARNVGDAIKDIERIEAAGAHLALVEEGVDPTGPFGRFLITILLAVATLERDNLSAGFEEAKRRAVARGAYISRTPWGYRRNEDGTLEPHPVRGPIVKEAFRKAATDGLHSAMAYLETKAPERSWTTTKVRRLLSGRSYLGETRNGKMVQTNTHEPLVERAVWERAQSLPVARGDKEEFPLTRLARCATCGGPMVGGRGGKGQRTYRCAGSLTTSKNRCDAPAVITASILENHARDHARSLLEGFRAIVGTDGGESIEELVQALQDAESELDAFASDLTARRTLGDRYHVYLSQRAEAVEEARKAYLTEAEKRSTQVVLSAASLDSDDPEVFATLLGSLFDSITVRRGRGLKVADKVSLVRVPIEGDEAARMASAQ